MAVQDWSTDPSLNTSIDGVNIAENCPPGNMNDMGRRIMASVRVFYNGVPSASTFVAATGGVFTGNPIFTGRGGYLHNNDPANTGGRVFIQAAGGSPPSGMVNGDILLEFQPS